MPRVAAGCPCRCHATSRHGGSVSFLLTLGPKPRIRCENCQNETELPTIDGTVRPGVLKQVRKSHVHGRPGDPWDVPADPRDMEADL